MTEGGAATVRISSHTLVGDEKGSIEIKKKKEIHAYIEKSGLCDIAVGVPHEKACRVPI